MRAENGLEGRWGARVGKDAATAVEGSNTVDPALQLLLLAEIGGGGDGGWGAASMKREEPIEGAMKSCEAARHSVRRKR